MNNNKLATTEKTRGWPIGWTRFDSLGFPSLSSFFDEVFYSPCRYIEDEKSYKLEIDLPGFKQSEVLVNVENGRVIINAENDKETYNHSFSLGREFDVDNIEARLENGRLTLLIPKSCKSEVKKIEIKS